MTFCDRIRLAFHYLISPLGWIGLERRHCVWWVWCSVPVVAALDVFSWPHPFVLGVGLMAFLFVFFCVTIILVSALATFLSPESLGQESDRSV